MMIYFVKVITIMVSGHTNIDRGLRKMAVIKVVNVDFNRCSYTMGNFPALHIKVLFRQGYSLVFPKLIQDTKWRLQYLQNISTKKNIFFHILRKYLIVAVLCT